MSDIQYDYELEIDRVSITTAEKRMITKIQFEESIESGKSSFLTFTMKQGLSQDFRDISLAKDVRSRADDLRLEHSVLFSIGKVGSHKTHMFQGYITNIETSFSEDDAPYIVVDCLDNSYRLKRPGLPKKCIDGITFDTWKKVVNEIIREFNPVQSKYGVFVFPSNALDGILSDDQSIEFGGLKDEEPSLFTISKGGSFYKNVIKEGDTPWQALKFIADKNDLKLYMFCNYIHMVREEWKRAGQVNILNMIYNPSKEDRNFIRLLKFESETSIFGNSNNIVSYAWVPDNKKSATQENGDFIESNRPSDYATWDAVISVPKGRYRIGPITGIAESIDESSSPVPPKMDENTKEILAGVLGFSMDSVIANGNQRLVADKTSYSGGYDRKSQTEQFLYKMYGNFKDFINGASLDRYIRGNLQIFSNKIKGNYSLSDDDPKLIASYDNRDMGQAEKHAKAVQAKVYEHLTTAEGLTQGDVCIRAGHKVNIKLNSFSSYGEDYSGKYTITDVKHTISSNGYMTSFSLSRPLARTRYYKMEKKDL